MRIWLVTIGEPLPTDGSAERLLRTGMLADILARRGHEVVWWTSTFDHARKRQRFERDTTVSVAGNYALRLIHTRPYPRNICLERWFSHQTVAKRFAALAAAEPKPDLILSSLPTVELCRAALDYAWPRGVPVALDIRDLWPDIFVDLAPRWLHGATKFALAPMFARLRNVCRRAQAILGTTNEYIDYVLAKVGRTARSWDRAFPLGYRRGRNSEAAIEAADSFWNRQGVARSAPEFICCYFGNMGRHCTLETVLLAAQAIERRGFRMRFVLCGMGDKLPRYRALAQGCGSVVFPGWIDAAQIEALMARCSVGLAPYVSNTNFQNNIPNKPIEYLSAGLPIVSSLQGVLERLITQHDCGATYDAGNVEQLTTLLLNLVQNPGHVRRMSDNARRLYQEKFDAQKVYGQMADHLERLTSVRNVSRELHPRKVQTLSPAFQTCSHTIR
ncbi:MAG TPA: glycosyltransferase family 4 protein [Pirellulales bacterium]|nr:glycosyltransferase family 4 protein [Pirellulales bacterium]